MPSVQSFEPVIGADPKIMILGSMPGVASLEAQQYYAHPRNAFWPIMGNLFAVEFDAEYDRRIRQLRALPLILWDVLRQCRRVGSLDTAIERDGLEANDLEGLIELHPELRAIAFNGSAAARLYHRHVGADKAHNAGIALLHLPSTSPANARLDVAGKLERWRCLLEFM